MATSNQSRGEPDPHHELRVVVLSCGGLGDRVARRLADLSEVGDVLLLTAPYRHRKRGLLSTLIRSLRYDGLLDTLASGLARLSKSAAQKGNGAPAPSFTAPGVEHRHVESFDATSSRALMRDFDPDLGVIAGTHILPGSVFEIPRLGSINLHTGKAPEYRGSAPAFWELFHGAGSVGITIHEVTSDLDAGRILLQESVGLDPMPAGDPVAYIAEYRTSVLEPAGVRLLAQAVAEVAQGTVEPRPQDESRARTFGPPTRMDVWRLRGRVVIRRIRRQVANLAGRVVYATGLYRRMLGDRAVVVLFHRVTEGAEGNPLARTPAEFERYCEFFARYFRVISLGELLEKLSEDADLSGHLVITFDDGYQDNYTLARPILEKYDLPACFFLATGYIGSERVPQWDKLRGERPAWMTWEQVSQLVDEGHEIGGHTRNHVDLGKVEGKEATREIVASLRDIARYTSVETAFFSFPFGGRDNFTDANRRRVRKAGFRCCLSAFGGIVGPGTDPMRLPRTPVGDWYVSPEHFGFELTRW